MERIFSMGPCNAQARRPLAFHSGKPPPPTGSPAPRSAELCAWSDKPNRSI